MSHEPDPKAFRAAHEHRMTCGQCHGQLMIVSAGVVCENGCGKIRHPQFVDIPCTVAFLKQVFPERVCASPAGKVSPVGDTGKSGTPSQSETDGLFAGRIRFDHAA